MGLILVEQGLKLVCMGRGPVKWLCVHKVAACVLVHLAHISGLLDLGESSLA